MRIIARSLVLTALAGQAIAEDTPRKPIANHVVIIGIDGLSPRGIDQASTPNIDALIARGARTFAARAILPTSSSSNWASMIMGAGPEHHGITSNGWERWDHSIKPTVAADEGIFPTIFSALREQRPGATIAVSYDWGGFGRLFQKSVVDHHHDGQGPDDTTDHAVRFLTEHKPDLLFVHLDHVDGAGHGNGWHTPPYFAAVSNADALVGRIVQAADDAGILDDTVFILTSDHGGVGTGHGGETMDEIEIPWIIAGPGVAQGREILRPVATYDTASTAAYVLGIEQPHAWVARPVTPAFEHADGSGVLYRHAPYLGSPAISPPAGLYKDNTVTVTIDTPFPGAVVRYTTDGSDPTDRSPRYRGPVMIEETSIVTAKAFTPTGESRASSNRYRIVSPDTPRHVRYDYYEGEWKFLPAFGSLPIVKSGTAPEFGLEFIDTREDAYGIRFEANLIIEQQGTYTFYTNSDDGSKLSINGRKIVDNDGSHGATERSGRIDLSPGVVPVVVEYFEDYGGETLEVFYAGPGVPKQTIPHTALAPLRESVRHGAE